MNPHERFGIQWRGLLEGNWQFEDSVHPSTSFHCMRLVVDFVNAIGFALERRGIDPLRFKTPPFPNFSYELALAGDSVLLLLGRSPVQSLRYAYYRDLHEYGEYDALQVVEEGLPWDKFLLATFPPLDNMMAGNGTEETRVINEEAERVVEQVLTMPMSSSKRAELQPIAIFPAGPFRKDDRLCFILMPFKDELQAIYDVGVKPAVESAGLDCRRADDIMDSGDVLTQIYRSLRAARVVIADLTGANGNVLYELGLAHMMGHRVILLTQTMADVPFDLRQQRHIVYQQSIEGVNALRENLGKALAVTLQEGSKGGA